MSKIIYCLLAEFYESVILPVNEEQVRFFSENKHTIPSLPMDQQLDLLYEHFPEYDEHPSYISGAIIEQKLEFEQLDEKYHVTGHLETENYTLKKIKPFQPIEIREPSIQVEIFSEGNTLTYYADKEINYETKLLLSGLQLNSGKEIISQIQTDIDSLSFYFKWLSLKHNKYRFNLL